MKPLVFARICWRILHQSIRVPLLVMIVGTAVCAAAPPRSLSIQEKDFLTALLPNTSATAQAELVEGGEAVTLNASLRVVFPTGLNYADGALSYVTLKPEAGSLLVQNPIVDVPAGLRATIVNLTAVPSQVTFGKGSIEGMEVRCIVRIAAIATSESARHTVSIALPGIGRVARAIGAISPKEIPTFRFALQVYESQAAYDKAKEVRRARMDQQRQEAAEALRQAEAEKAEQTRRLVTTTAAALLLVILVGGVVFPFRKWIWPNAKAKLSPGGHQQQCGVVAARPGDEREDPGTVLETLWARDRRGQRQGIKVEVLLATDAGEAGGGATPEGLRSGPAIAPDAGAAVQPRLDVLVTVGASVASGLYLAEGSHGVVRVQVA